MLKTKLNHFRITDPDTFLLDSIYGGRIWERSFIAGLSELWSIGTRTESFHKFWPCATTPWWTQSDVEWDLEIYRHVISQILIIIGSGCKSNNFYHHFTVCHFSTGQTCKRCLTIYSGPLRTINLNKLSSLILEIMTLVCKDLHWQLSGSHKVWHTYQCCNEYYE